MFAEQRRQFFCALGGGAERKTDRQTKTFRKKDAEGDRDTIRKDRERERHIKEREFKERERHKWGEKERQRQRDTEAGE